MMIEYRPFRNTDPPAICEIWRNHSPLRALYQPLTPNLLETLVLSKPFFDRDGLIVACEDHKPVGFAHAGFGSSGDGSHLDRSLGATCMLMVAQTQRCGEIAQQLLLRSEGYLRRGGASQLLGGGNACVAPFYLGLYGGATLPGVLATDAAQMETFGEAGYMETRRTKILQRSLAAFRPVVDRQQMLLKRRMVVDAQDEPLANNWWEACTRGLTDQFAYVARTRADSQHQGSVVFWDLEPLASCWGTHTRGLADLQVTAGEDQEAMTLYLLGETLRLLANNGVTLAEAHVNSQDEAMLQVVQRLGFQEVECGIQWSKPTPT